MVAALNFKEILQQQLVDGRNYWLQFTVTGAVDLRSPVLLFAFPSPAMLPSRSQFPCSLSQWPSPRSFPGLPAPHPCHLLMLDVQVWMGGCGWCVSGVVQCVNMVLNDSMACKRGVNGSAAWHHF